MVMKLDKTQRSKQRSKIYVGTSTTVHNLLLCVLTLCMNYVTKTFYWVFPRPVVSSYCVLLTVKATKENKNIQQRISSFITCTPIKCSRDFVYLLLKRYISKWQLAMASTGLVQVQKIKRLSKTIV